MALLHAGTVALVIRHVLCAPLRLVRYVERRDYTPAEQAIGVLYLDSRERGALVSESARSALEMLSAEAASLLRSALTAKPHRLSSKILMRTAKELSSAFQHRNARHRVQRQNPPRTILPVSSTSALAARCIWSAVARAARR